MHDIDLVAPLPAASGQYDRWSLESVTTLRTAVILTQPCRVNGSSRSLAPLLNWNSLLASLQHHLGVNNFTCDF